MKNSNSVAIIGIIASVIGTLLGAGIGAFGTMYQQEKRMEYQDRTRFHEIRLNVYSKFILHTANIAESCKEGKPPDTRDINAANEATASLIIVGSPDVTDGARVIAGAILQADKNPTNCSNIGKEIYNKLYEVVESMKAEINIDSRN